MGRGVFVLEKVGIPMVKIKKINVLANFGI